MTLDQLDIGEFGEIVSIIGEGAIRARLMDMGFVEGTCVEMMRRAPMGGPFEVRARGTLISLRPEEARMVVIMPLRRHRRMGKGKHGRGRGRRGGFWRRMFGHPRDEEG